MGLGVKGEGAGMDGRAEGQVVAGSLGGEQSLTFLQAAFPAPPAAPSPLSTSSCHFIPSLFFNLLKYVPLIHLQAEGAHMQIKWGSASPLQTRGWRKAGSLCWPPTSAPGLERESMLG